MKATTITAAHYKHTARLHLKQQDTPPLYKPSCFQSSKPCTCTPHSRTAAHVLLDAGMAVPVPCIACIFRTTYSQMAFPIMYVPFARARSQSNRVVHSGRQLSDDIGLLGERVAGCSLCVRGCLTWMLLDSARLKHTWPNHVQF